MSLEQLSKTVDFVQDATPSDANDGETYLDTSQSPPQLKVFDAGVGAFVRPRSIQNLDAPVSGAGATQTDIEAGAEGALEQDIANLSPASNSVAANLDGGVAAVDWSNKTPKSQSTSNVSIQGVTVRTLISVTGSGYLRSASIRLGTDQDEVFGELVVDGTVIGSKPFSERIVLGNAEKYNGSSSGEVAVYFDGQKRFDSSLTVQVNETRGQSVTAAAEVEYELD